MMLDQTALLENVRRISGLNGETSADTLLFSSGALDSLAMLSLIGLVEQMAGIQINAEDVTLDNFDSVARIARFANARAA
jgi:D-alanine--poly(phosphoribitol) ligase subunit 2